MFQIDFKSDIARTLKNVEATERAVKRATVRTLNRVLDSVNTVASRDIAKATGFRVSEVRRYLIRTRATGSLLRAELRSPKRSPNLIHFRAKQNATGVTAVVFGKRKKFPHWFIVHGDRVMRRVPGAPKVPAKKGRYAGTNALRQPIEPRFGPPLAKVLLSRAIVQAMDKTARDTWAKNFRRNLEFEARKRR